MVYIISPAPGISSGPGVGVPLHLFPDRLFDVGIHRNAGGGRRLADTHLLSGAGATARLTAAGGIAYVKDGVAADRFADDFLRVRDGIFTHVRHVETGREAVFGEAAEPGERRIRFDAGMALYPLNLDGIEMALAVCVSPEDGTLILRVSAENAGDAPATLGLRSPEPPLRFLLPSRVLGTGNRGAAEKPASPPGPW